MAYCTETCLLPLPTPPHIIRCKRQTAIQHKWIQHYVIHWLYFVTYKCRHSLCWCSTDTPPELWDLSSDLLIIQTRSGTLSYLSLYQTFGENLQILAGQGYLNKELEKNRSLHWLGFNDFLNHSRPCQCWSLGITFNNNKSRL